MRPLANLATFHRLTRSRAWPKAEGDEAWMTDASLGLLLGIIVVVISVVLLLSQGDPGVGMAP
jgi:hypothetical protein